MTMDTTGLQVVSATVLLVFTLYTGQNFLRYLKAINTPEGKNGVLGILLACALGIGVASWAANSSATAGLVLIKAAGPLGKLDFGSLCLLGVMLGSGGSAFTDWRKAKDNNDSSAKPPIVKQ